MARSTVGAVLRRLGLGRLSLLEPKPPIIRYERDRPGEMIRLDIKKLGQINGVGHRFVGRGPGTHNLGKGWDFLHVCVDDASRLAYTELLPSEGQHDTTAFLKRALDWLSRHGVTVERVMTDNGSAYRSKLFAAALRQAGARHVRTRPYTPRTNGKGRTLHPDLLARMGLRQTLRFVRRARRCYQALDRRLQHLPTALRHQRLNPVATGE